MASERARIHRDQCPGLKAVRMLQDLAVWSIALPNVAPVNGFVTCGCQKFDPHRTEVHIDKEPHAEIGISISSTRQAA